MVWNPHSAFPRQSTYIPDAGHRGFQQAVNAPSFSGVGHGPVQQMTSLQHAYAQNAATAAQLGYSGTQGAAVVRGMQERFNHGYLANTSTRLHGFANVAARQRGNQLLGAKISSEMASRAQDVLASTATPLAATVRPGMHGAAMDPGEFQKMIADLDPAEEQRLDAVSRSVNWGRDQPHYNLLTQPVTDEPIPARRRRTTVGHVY